MLCFTESFDGYGEGALDDLLWLTSNPWTDFSWPGQPSFTTEQARTGTRSLKCAGRTDLHLRALFPSEAPGSPGLRDIVGGFCFGFYSGLDWDGSHAPCVAVVPVMGEAVYPIFRIFVNPDGTLSVCEDRTDPYNITHTTAPVLLPDTWQNIAVEFQPYVDSGDVFCSLKLYVDEDVVLDEVLAYPFGSPPVMNVSWNACPIVFSTVYRDPPPDDSPVFFIDDLLTWTREVPDARYDWVEYPGPCYVYPFLPTSVFPPPYEPTYLWGGDATSYVDAVAKDAIDTGGYLHFDYDAMSSDLYGDAAYLLGNQNFPDNILAVDSIALGGVVSEDYAIEFYRYFGEDPYTNYAYFDRWWTWQIDVPLFMYWPQQYTWDMFNWTPGNLATCCWGVEGYYWEIPPPEDWEYCDARYYQLFFNVVSLDPPGPVPDNLPLWGAMEGRRVKVSNYNLTGGQSYLLKLQSNKRGGNK